MPQVLNLGQVSAIKISSVPPTNTKLLWYDTNIVSGVNIKYFDLTKNAWVLLNEGISTEIDDDSISLNSTWSSQKISDDYYSKFDLQTSGQAQVHWNNVTNIDLTTQTGFGLSWNVDKIEWGVGTTYLGLPAREVIFPDSLIFTLGTGVTGGSGNHLVIGNDTINITSAINAANYYLLRISHNDINQKYIFLGKYDEHDKGIYQSENNDFRYTHDFSTFYTNRSLVDKEYVDNHVPDLSGYATESWVESKNYITLSDIPAAQTLGWNSSTGALSVSQGNSVNLDGRYSLIGHTHDISDITGLQTALNGKVNTSTTMTQGYGILVTGNWSSGWGFSLNESVLDNRYLRKDQDDSSVYDYTFGDLEAANLVVDGGLNLPSLSVGTSNDVLVVNSSGLVQKKTLSISGAWGVANSSGTKQFDVALGSNLRFAATGDASVSFNSATNTITINSVPGSGTGGVVTSVFGRDGAVVAEIGDYSTTQVTEGSNLYFTEARVRATPLTGFSATNSAILATDTVLQALGKAQGQLNNRALSSRTIEVSGTAGNITVSGGVQNLTANRTWTVNLASAGTAGTYTKVTTDAYGRVISGASLSASDIPALPANKITSGTIATARLGSGTASASTVLYGDGSWKTLPAIPAPQTLSVNITESILSISDGNNVNIYSLRPVSRQDATERYNASVFTPFTTSAGHSGYIGGTEFGAGIRIERRSGDTSQTGWQIYKRANVDALYYKTFDSTSTENNWQTIATQSWVTSQIPSVPTNYVTSNTNQTGLSGNKSWIGRHEISNTSVGNLLHIIRQGQSVNANIRYAADGTGNEVWAGLGDSETFTVGPTSNLSSTGSHWAKISASGIDLPRGSSVSNGPYYAGGSVILGANTSGATAVAANNNTIYLRPNGANSGEGDFSLASSGTITAKGLAGTGTQMVVANASGVLSRQAIPAVGVTQVTAGNGMNFTTITGTGAVTLGTPGTLTASTSNGVTSTSHTHAITTTTSGAANTIVQTNASGVITASGGNSSQWNAAYGWGDHGASGYWNRDRNSANQVASGDNVDANTIHPNGGFSFSYGSANWASNLAFNEYGGLITYRGSSSGGNPRGRLQIQYGIGHSSDANSRIAFRTEYGTSGGAWRSWKELWHSGNFTPSDYTPTARTITAGNGLTGGGSLAANRTITLGTPGTITLSSTNSVSTSSHTHNFAPGGTSSQYIRGDGSLATFPSIPAGTVTSITAGTDLSGGTITSSGTIAFAPRTGTWINDISSNPRLYLGPATGSLGVLLRSSSPAGHFQFRTSDNAIIWDVGEDGTLETGIIPWARLTGIPSYVPTGRTITLTAGSNVTITGGTQTLAGNRTWTISATNTTYTASTGLTLSSGAFSITNIAAGSTSSGALRYNGTTRSAGRLYGGTTNPVSTTRLNYDGILHVGGLLSAGASDISLKENIKRIANPIEKLSKLNGYSFKWKDGNENYKGYDYGLIAQEVERVLPEIIVDNGQYKSIKNGNQLIGLLIEGFNALRKRVEELENGLS